MLRCISSNDNYLSLSVKWIIITFINKILNIYSYTWKKRNFTIVTKVFRKRVKIFFVQNSIFLKECTICESGTYGRMVSETGGHRINIRLWRRSSHLQKWNKVRRLRIEVKGILEFSMEQFTCHRNDITWHDMTCNEGIKVWRYELGLALSSP